MTESVASAAPRRTRGCAGCSPACLPPVIYIILHIISFAYILYILFYMQVVVLLLMQTEIRLESISPSQTKAGYILVLVDFHKSVFKSRWNKSTGTNLVTE